MKKHFPTFLAGMCTMLFIGTITVSALAISGRMTIEVDPIKVMVNGEVFQPKDAGGNDVPVFAYNGTTYAPLRALAEAYGLEVGYDAEKNMATVSNTTGDSNKDIASVTQTTTSDYYASVSSLPQSMQKNDVKIERIVLLEKGVTLKQGEKYNITATCLPMYATPDLTWSSSNPSVVMLQNIDTFKDDDGNYFARVAVNAIAEGRATVTITAPSGVEEQFDVTVFGGNIEMAQEAVNALRSVLKLPSSLSINSVRVFQSKVRTGVEIDYSAMNGFGGYNRSYFMYYSSTEYFDSKGSVIDAHNHPYVSININELQ